MKQSAIFSSVHWCRNSQLFSRMQLIHKNITTSIDILDNVEIPLYNFQNISVLLPITYYLIGTSLPAKHIPFLHCSFLWMSSISAHQVPIVIQVPIQATQHKDDTNPLCISSVLFRVLCHYSFLWMFLHPTQHKDDTLYPS